MWTDGVRIEPASVRSRPPDGSDSHRGSSAASLAAQVMNPHSLRVDISRLIRMVEERAVLWDKTAENYRHKQVTKDTWDEIIEVFVPHYRQMSPTEQDEYGRAVMKKWWNVRDGYVKAKRRQKEGSAELGRKYRHDNQLRFLDKLVPLPGGQVGSDAHGCQSWDSGPEQEPEYLEVAAESPFDFKPYHPFVDSSQGFAPEEKRRRTSVDTRPHPFPSEPTNRHLSFFMGIVPSLDALDEDETIEFQMGVLQLIKDLKHQKSLKAQQQQSQAAAPTSSSQQNFHFLKQEEQQFL